MILPRSFRRYLHVLAAALLLACAVVSPVPPRGTAGAAGVTPDVDRILASLSPEERVGQAVMVNFTGDDVSAESDVAGLIRDFNVGAVLVTASNGNIINRDDTAAQLAALTNGLQQRASESNARSGARGEYFVPLLIATDNEGDLFPFTNVTHNYTSVPNAMTIGATWSKQHAEATGAVIGRELSAAGINMLLGPVVDVLENPRSGGNGDIGIRSFGGNPVWVGQLGRAYVRGVHTGSDGRMLTVAKHFPGHGGSDRGTDNEVPTVNKSLDQLRASDLTPFAEALRQDPNDPAGTADAMMVSHIRYRNFLAGGGAPFTRPISLDAAAFNQLMDLPEFSPWRGTHLVMSDSLGVPAVKKWYAQEGQPEFPNRTVVRDALLAGSDLLPLVEFFRDPDERGWHDHQLPVIQDSILYMREQYAIDAEFRRRVDEAARQVIAAKLKLYPQFDLNTVQVDPANAAEVAGTGDEQMRALADDALTLIQPQSVGELRARLPRGPVTPDRVLIIECWADCYPYRVMPRLQLQDQLLALYGPDGAGRLRSDDVETVSFGELDAWMAAPDDPATAETARAVADATWIVLALTEYNPADRPVSGAARRLLDASPIDLRNKTLVAIAYNVPYHLDSTEISKLAAYVAVYSKTDAAIESGFRAIFGDITPEGHSPVNVSGIFYGVNEATQPAPDQKVALGVFGQDASEIADAPLVGLVAGPIVDRNGNPVPDGTIVSFSITKSGRSTITGAGRTIDGVAGAPLALDGRGEYVATASLGSLASDPLTLTVAGSAGAAPTTAPPAPGVATSSDDGNGGMVLLALGIGIPAGVAIAAFAVGAVVVYRRRANASRAPVDASDAPAPAAEVPTVLHLDDDTRRVYIKGVELKPPLSNEQFRLLSHLISRRGKVVPREDLITHVWPDAHAEGVSEEALDALVRRVRERLAQGGGERSYIVTLRGQGFRLDV